MRVLVVGINYTPEHAGIAPYTAGLCEHLATAGHEVHVVTGLPHYPGWKRDRDQALPEEKGLLKGVHIHRRWHYIPGSQSALRRALYELSFLGTGVSLVLLPRPDVVLGVVPTLSGGILARLAARRFGVPYAIVEQDLMGQAAAQSGVAGGASVARLTRAIEGWVAKGAARVAIIADGFRDYFLQLGIAPERIIRVRNWSFLPEATSDRTTVRRRLGWPEDAFVCLHAGNMGYKQGLENLVDCANLARSHPRLFFSLVGDGNRRQALEEKTKAMKLTNLHFGSTLDDEAYADALAAADVLVLSQSAAVRDMSFPSKLASYLASGRPVIAAVDTASEVGRELIQAGAGLVVPPGKPDALLEGILKLACDTKLVESFIQAGRPLLFRLFSRDAALRELETLIDAIAKRASHNVPLRSGERA